MDEFLEHVTDEFEQIVDFVPGQAAFAINVECAKCGDIVPSTVVPTKKPACSRCYTLIVDLKIARAQGFKVGF